MKSSIALIRIAICLAAFFLIAPGCENPVTGPPVSKTILGDVAINGFDTVAYFRAGKAVKGSETYSVTWNGAKWYFSNAENRDLFAADQKKYAPQYGGYCAWAMTEARKARTDPEVWKIVDGRLYLNCSRIAFNKWQKDIPGNIKKADANWRNIIGGK